MLWDKNKYAVKLHGGRGRLVTKPMHGMIQHLIVSPANDTTVWSLSICDGEGDEIVYRSDILGRFDDRQELPVGRDKPESLAVLLFDSTANEEFDVIFKVREVR